MKILEIRLNNLNSLYGEWIVDFTHPQYTTNKIFALTGPTGAGKSTILDAVCLALYGATPRLGKITKRENQIMSRHTTECYAEVLFQSSESTFRVHWEQRRSHKTNSLQEPEHQIIDAASGTPIETKRTLVLKQIEEKTGLDFNRFTRSMLLAQGKFDAFLAANDEEKSKILEQISGTEIYSTLSIRVHERCRDEKEKLAHLNSQRDAIHVLEKSEEKEIQERLKQCTQREPVLKKERETIRKSIEWQHGVDSLSQKITTISEELHQLQNAIDNFTEKRARLTLAHRAAQLDGIYATLTETRKLQTQDQTELTTHTQEVSELTPKVKDHKERVAAAIQEKEKREATLAKRKPILESIRALDTRLQEKNRVLLESQVDYNKEQTRVEENTALKDDVSKEKEMAIQEQHKIEHYLKEHAPDQWLESNLTEVVQQITQLQGALQEAKAKEEERQHKANEAEKALGRLNSLRQEYDAKRQHYDTLSAELKQEQENLTQLLEGRALTEYRREKDSLLREQALANKVVQLEQERAHLIEGTPCPLCGATHHPYATETPSTSDIEKSIAHLQEKIAHAEEHQQHIQKLTEQKTTAHTALLQSESQRDHAAETHTQANTQLQTHTQQFATIQEQYNTKVVNLTEALKPLGIDIIPNDNLSALLEFLKHRAKDWKQYTQAQQRGHARVKEIDHRLAALDTIIENHRNALRDKEESLKKIKDDVDATEQERTTRYGAANPTHEEEALTRAIKLAQDTEGDAKETLSQLQQQLVVATNTSQKLRTRIDQRSGELRSQEGQFSTGLNSAQFLTEEQFLAARCTPEERDSLTAEAQRLDHEHTQLSALHKEYRTSMAKEKAKKVTTKSAAELQAQLTAHEQELEHIQSSIFDLTHTLKEHKDATARRHQQQTAIEAQGQECTRWERLHALIGSADGKKYRTFAQGITFELMIKYANQHLMKIHDRYLLTRDTGSGTRLALNVIDNYQGGEVRSTDSLSGGERFIVSLALALGLSSMASRKVRVDSLFLDEGFGTLDEEALEAALEALSHLYQQDKLIGVISHVTELKERITTQIVVTPLHGGKSTLRGPGCRRA